MASFEIFPGGINNRNNRDQQRQVNHFIIDLNCKLFIISLLPTLLLMAFQILNIQILTTVDRDILIYLVDHDYRKNDFTKICFFHHPTLPLILISA